MRNPFRVIYEYESRHINNAAFRDGFVYIGKGIWILCRETCRSIYSLGKSFLLCVHRSILRYPYPWIFFILMGSLIYNFVYIGQCRVERDGAMIDSYAVSCKNDSLSLMLESYKYSNGELKKEIDSLKREKISRKVVGAPVIKKANASVDTLNVLN